MIFLDFVGMLFKFMDFIFCMLLYGLKGLKLFCNILNGLKFFIIKKYFKFYFFIYLFVFVSIYKDNRKEIIRNVY